MSHDARARRSSASAEEAVVEGGCHCGFVRFTVHGRPRSALLCNCSICSMKGYVHWIIERARFRLTSPADEAALPAYRFGTRVAAHYFCPVCGVAAFYVPRSDPDKIDINLRCVAGLDVDRIPLERFDGARWEEAYASYRGEDGDGAGS